MKIPLLKYQGFFFSLAALWPAFLNRSPLVFSDTSSYFQNIGGVDIAVRAPGYSIFVFYINFFNSGLWQLVAIQSVFVITLLLHLTKDLLGKSYCDKKAFFIIGTLMLASSLPWFTSLVMADYCASISAIALFMLLKRWNQMRLWQRFLWSGLLFLMASTHLAYSPVIVGTIACLGLIDGFRNGWRVFSWKKLLLITFLTLIAVPTIRYALFRNFKFSNNAVTFLAARISHDGILGDYLDKVCDHDPVNQTEELCNSPEDTRRLGIEDFLWHIPHPYISKFGFDGASGPLKEIVLKAILMFPGKFLYYSTVDSLRTLLEFGITDDFLEPPPILFGRMEAFFPSALNEYENSRIFENTLKQFYEGVHSLDRVFFLLALSLGIFWLISKKGSNEARAFFIHTLVFCTINAIVSGAISGPFNRYQSRINWLIVFACLIMILSDNKFPAIKLKKQK